jgi:nicotinamide-nucleotide amidase
LGEKRLSAAVVTVGSELVSGLQLDTNTREIAATLTAHMYSVVECVSVGDEMEILTSTLGRLCGAYPMVVVTGGLGPTHDDITRQAAAAAMGISMTSSADLVTDLRNRGWRHLDPEAASQVYRQADVLDGARVIPAVTGTAPGQMVPTPAGVLVLLPGPPSEMRPMLEMLGEGRTAATPSRILRCSGISESDAQVIASRVVASHPGVGMGVLASPGDVRVVLTDTDAGPVELDKAATSVADEIGWACYSTDGAALAEVVLRLARNAGVKLGTAESCTGGLIAAELTSVPGSSASFSGSVVTYSNRSKVDILGVPEAVLADWGAVSEQTATSMALNARTTIGCDVSLAVTGIAGPDGGTPDKPVGTVWFCLASSNETVTKMVRIPGNRELVRLRATSMGLDMMRRELGGD